MRHKQMVTVITGGAGFVGANLADRLCKMGRRVLIYDNLSRLGVEQNLQWLQSQHGSLIEAEIADVRDKKRLAAAVARADSVFHFAAQVAVTNSLVDPVHDFEVNVVGTINLLEALRALAKPPTLVFTSTNKVYGNLADVSMRAASLRYEPENLRVREHGVSEARALDFHSPYGCSKGAADQYVMDYARTFGLPAAVFRMSCIYGPHQFGTEDQGWVAHFLIRAVEGQPITLYGDGKQVRDILYVDDLVNAFLLAEQHIEATAGQAFNIGGGTANTTSLLELMQLIQTLHGGAPEIVFEDWRTGDQHYYVSDTTKFRSLTGWKPAVGIREGVHRLYDWLLETRAPAFAHEQRRAAS